MIYLTFTPRDPIIARDGRPFGLGVGRHVKSVQWPYPSVLAGSLRTLMGKLLGGGFGPDTVENLKSVTIAGPLPMYDGQLFLPAPKDVFFFASSAVRDDAEAHLGYLPKRPFCPRPEEEGCDNPAGLLPVAPLQTEEEEIKGIGNPAFWSMQRMTEWLSTPNGEGLAPPPYLEEDAEIENRSLRMVRRGFLQSPATDRRIHVKIDSSTLAAEEQMLFSTSGLDMAEGLVMSARITEAGDFSHVLENLDTYHPFGGERRLVHWHRDTDAENAWACPDRIGQALGGAAGIRMVLAAPGIFKHGWKPGWLEEGLVGHPPGLPSVTLKLVGAVIDRRQPISGWSLESNGPKPIRRLVPAGSVYFFRVEEGDPRELADKLWLQSVCDAPQDRCDGFGSALWGVWDDTAVKGGV